PRTRIREESWPKKRHDETRDAYSHDNPRNNHSLRKQRGVHGRTSGYSVATFDRPAQCTDGKREPSCNSTHDDEHWERGYSAGPVETEADLNRGHTGGERCSDSCDDAGAHVPPNAPVQLPGIAVCDLALYGSPSAATACYAACANNRVLSQCYGSGSPGSRSRT